MKKEEDFSDQVDADEYEQNSKPQEIIQKEEVVEDFSPEIKKEYDSNVAFKKKYMPKLQPIPENSP